MVEGRSKDLVEKLTPCPNEQYCLLKVMVSTIDPRIIEQVDCVEIFKYELNEKSPRKIGPEEVWKIWSDRGYAKAFNKVYTPDKESRDIYLEILGQNGGIEEAVKDL